MILVYFILLPFIQLGLSYYASIATVSAIIVAILFRRQLRAGLSANVYVLGVAVLMIPSLFSAESLEPAQDALRVLREALLLILIVSVIDGSSRQVARMDQNRVRRYTSCLLGALFLLTIVQVLFLAKGAYLGFGPDAYVNGGSGGTVPDELALKYVHVRPAATFSEPSYLSFIVLSLLVMIIPTIGDMKRKIALIALALVTGAMSQAASFVFFSLMIMFTHIFERANASQRVILMIATVFGLTIVMLFAAEIAPVARVVSGGHAGGDSSIYERIFGPMRALPSFLADHPFGVPVNSLDHVLTPYARADGMTGANFIHNSALNFFFEYGILGIFVMVPLFLVARDNIVRAYLLSCMLFNGGFLAIDKFAVIGFTVCAYAAFRRQADKVAIARRQKMMQLRLATAI